MQKAILDAFLWLGLRLQGFSASNAEILVRLARLETGNYESSAFRLHRNVFGMGVVAQRPTTQTGGHANADAGIGHYNSLWSSIRDLRMWFDYWGFGRGSNLPEEFWSRYNPSAEYRSAVLGVSHQIGRGLSVFALLAPLTALAVHQILKRV